MRDTKLHTARVTHSCETENSDDEVSVLLGLLTLVRLNTRMMKSAYC